MADWEATMKECEKFYDAHWQDFSQSATLPESLKTTLAGLNPDVKEDKEHLLELMNSFGQGGPYFFNRLNEAARADRDITCAAVKTRGACLQYTTAALRDDKELVMLAVTVGRQSTTELSFASDRLRNDREIVIAVINSFGGELQFASPEMRKDKEVARVALTLAGCPQFLDYDGLKGDKEFELMIPLARNRDSDSDFPLTDETKELLKGLQTDTHLDLLVDVVRMNGMCLQYMNEAARSTSDIVFAAVQQTIEAVQFSDPPFIFHNEAVWSYVVGYMKKKREGFFIFFHEPVTSLVKKLELPRDWEPIMKLVTSCGLLLGFLSPSICNDNEIVHCAVSNNKGALEFAKGWSKELGTLELGSLKSSHMIMEALQEDGQCIRYMPESVRGNREAGLAAVKSNGEALNFLSDELKDDKDVALAALEELWIKYQDNRANETMEACQKAWKAISARLRQDKEVVVAHVTKDKANAIIEYDYKMPYNKDLVIAVVKPKGHGALLQYAPQCYLNDKDVILAAIRGEGEDVSRVPIPSEFLNDKEVALAAVRENGSVLTTLSLDMKNNKDVVMAAVGDDSYGGVFFNYYDIVKASEEMRNDRDVVLAAIRFGPKDQDNSFRLASDEMRKDKDVALAAVSRWGLCLEDADSELKNDKQVVLAAVNNAGSALEHASDDLKGDRDVVLAAVGNPEWGPDSDEKPPISFASESLRNDKDIVLIAVNARGDALSAVPEQFRNQKDVVLAAVRHGQTPDLDHPLKAASDELKNDRDVVLVAVNRDGSALQHASEERKKDKDVVLAAVSQQGHMLKHAPDEMKKDKDIALAAVRKKGQALKHTSEEVRDKEVVLAAVRQDGMALNSVSEELGKDKEVVMTAVRQEGGSLQCVCDHWGTDKEVVLAAMATNGAAIQFASKELCGDMEVVMTAVKQNGDALCRASDELKNNKEVVLAAVSERGSALKYASKELKMDQEVKDACKPASG